MDKMCRKGQDVRYVDPLFRAVVTRRDLLSSAVKELKTLLKPVYLDHDPRLQDIGHVEKRWDILELTLWPGFLLDVNYVLVMGDSSLSE